MDVGGGVVGEEGACLIHGFYSYVVIPYLVSIWMYLIYVHCMWMQLLIMQLL